MSRVDSSWAIYQRLREENEELQERVRQLEAIIAADTGRWRMLFDLSPTQEILFSCLVNSPLASHRAMQDALDERRGDCCSASRLKVHICNIRKKLSPHGIEIHSVWGEGYRLDERTRLRMKAALQEQDAAA